MEQSARRERRAESARIGARQAAGVASGLGRKAIPPKGRAWTTHRRRRRECRDRRRLRSERRRARRVTQAPEGRPGRSRSKNPASPAWGVAGFPRSNGEAETQTRPRGKAFPRRHRECSRNPLSTRRQTVSGRTQWWRTVEDWAPDSEWLEPEKRPGAGPVVFKWPPKWRFSPRDRCAAYFFFST